MAKKRPEPQAARWVRIPVAVKGMVSANVRCREDFVGPATVYWDDGKKTGRATLPGAFLEPLCRPPAPAASPTPPSERAVAPSAPAEAK
jgi:hypothetical protein